jgi:hypothetical protein
MLTRLQCTDGGMGQNIGFHGCIGLTLGILFMQPDMLDPSRIRDDDFVVKVGYTLVLLEYRVQQSPQTHLYLVIWC